MIRIHSDTKWKMTDRAPSRNQSTFALMKDKALALAY